MTTVRITGERPYCIRAMSPSLGSVDGLKLGGAERWTPWNQPSWTKRELCGTSANHNRCPQRLHSEPAAVGRPLPSGYLSADPFRGGIALGEGQMGRLFGFFSVVIVLAVGMYVYSKQLQSSSAPAGANTPKAAINITGVRSDLISIATAERRYFASEGKYVSLDELISTNYLTVARQRPPYTYEVQIGSSGFRVVAIRSGDNTSGTPAQLSVDENMEFQTSE
jgi:hypothetical protein